MKVKVDNVTRIQYSCFSYPNKEVKKIELDRVQYNEVQKDIKIEFDNYYDRKLFIMSLLTDNNMFDDFEFRNLIKDIITGYEDNEDSYDQ